MGNIAVSLYWILHIRIELVVQVNIIGFTQTIFDVYDLFHGLAEIDESILSQLKIMLTQDLGVLFIPNYKRHIFLSCGIAPTWPVGLVGTL